MNQSNVIDGKQLATQRKEQVAKQVARRKSDGKRVCLAVVIVGEDPASQVYVNAKHKACELVGIESKQIALKSDTSEAELLSLVQTLNQDQAVQGILVQLPLPKQISEQRIIEAIDPHKDVDAFHPYHVGKLMIGDADLLPCTPAGCMQLIASTGVDLVGKHAVIVGRSNIVGKPMSMLLLHRSATVTICHSKTADLAAVCRAADILVAAVGVPQLITAEMVKPGAIVIDVGINRLSDGRLVGDVAFDEVRAVCGAITPVPGGVGPMTIATLLQNTVTAAILQERYATQEAV